MIIGQLDSTVACDDGTLTILDFRTREPKSNQVGIYGRQLHAYALAAERPAGGKPRSVSGLGLVCFLPDWFQSDKSEAMLAGDLSFVPVAVDRAGFESFLQKMGALVSQPPAPAPSSTCAWCQWQHAEAS